MINFEEVWQKIMINLRPGITIRNWTALRGYLGDEMKVVEVSGSRVVIEAPKAEHLLSVSRKDFQLVWEVWPVYQAGRMQRQEIRDMTFFSKYIINILYWMTPLQKRLDKKGKSLI